MTTPTPDDAASFDLDGARAQIDEIDAAICDLIRRRHSVSVDIQRARMVHGDSRISHARENQVLNSYGDRLGKQGVAISLAILELCRGRGA